MEPGRPGFVEREVKVYDGTFLDYALKLDGTPRVYVEAKGLNENLDDKKFIAQAVNYANNDGVLWCVLTNGWRVRVYKTNEPVAMDRKLLFEVDLTDTPRPPRDKAKQLRLISREAVEAGDLDRFGERVFTDGRVREGARGARQRPASGRARRGQRRGSGIPAFRRMRSSAASRGFSTPLAARACFDTGAVAAKASGAAPAGRRPRRRARSTTSTTTSATRAR